MHALTLLSVQLKPLNSAQGSFGYCYKDNKEMFKPSYMPINKRGLIRLP